MELNYEQTVILDYLKDNSKYNYPIPVISRLSKDPMNLPTEVTNAYINLNPYEESEVLYEYSKYCLELNSAVVDKL